MGKVLLVNYAGYWMTANSFIADSSLALLAGVLLQNGINTEIVDFQNTEDVGKIMEYQEGPWAKNIVEAMKSKRPLDEKDLEGYWRQRTLGQEEFEKEKTKWLIEKIKKEHVSAVGFKLWIGNGLKGAIAMAKEIKKNFPDVKVIAGGPGVQFAQEYFYEYTDAFDHAVYGEAEEILVPLLEGNTDVYNLMCPNGKITRKDFTKDINQPPVPVYDEKIYPTIKGFHKIRIIDDSRGCFNKCAFCSHTTFSGTHIRKKDPQRVVDEMQKAYCEDGIQFFRLSGSNPPWKFLVSIAEEILKRKLPVFYSAFSSFNNTNKKDFELLYQSGLRSLLYGLESGDPEFLKRVHNKSNLSHEHIISTSQAAMKAGIFIGLSVIYPSPFETKETRQTTLALIKEIFSEHKNGSVFTSPPLLSQGSRWWENMEEYGFSFPKGHDKKSFIMDVLTWDPNFLLPRDRLSPLPYSVENKSCLQIFAENQEFTRELESLGITTNIDDTAYMLGLLKDLPPLEFKLWTIESLILGGQERLKAQISQEAFSTTYGTSKEANY